MEEYLKPSQYIDWDSPSILALAEQLQAENGNDEETAKASFEWVRDTIKHSADHKLNPITCKASDVLEHGTGFCFAKSHLLAAVLRANKIPAGLCYQRLSIDGDGPPYSLHGLISVYLEDHGWYRVDPRGNKPGVDSVFNPPQEQLAFSLTDKNEIDFPDVLPEPLPSVVNVLTRYATYQEVIDNLPDAKELLAERGGSSISTLIP